MAQVCSRKYENQMDIALARLIVFGQKDIKFPENERELRPFCNEATRMWDRVGTYSKKCLNNFGKNAYSVLAHTISGEMKSICKPGRVNKRAQSLLEASKCGNIGNEMIYKNCYTKMVDSVTGALSVDVKRRIPICCWSVHQFTLKIN